MRQRWTWQGRGKARKTLLLLKSFSAGVEIALEYSGGKDVPRPCDVLSRRQSWRRRLGYRPTVFLLNGLCLSAGLSLPA